MGGGEKPNAGWARHGDDTGLSGKDIKFAGSGMDTGGANALGAVFSVFGQQGGYHHSVNDFNAQPL